MSVFILEAFFISHELTKIVLESSTKLYGVNLNHLAWRTEPKSNIQYRARLKGPSFQFFGIVTLFLKKNPQRASPHFLMFSDRMDVEKFQRVHPDRFIRYCWNFLEFFFNKRSPLQCFVIEWMLKNSKGSTFLVFSALRDFFSEKFFHQRVPLQFS